MNKLDTRVKIVSIQKSKDEKGIDVCYGSLQIKMQGELDRETKERKEVIEEISYKAKGLVAQSLVEGQIYQVSGDFHIYQKTNDSNGIPQNPDLILIIEKASSTNNGKIKQTLKNLSVSAANELITPVIEEQILETNPVVEALEEEAVPF